MPDDPISLEDPHETPAPGAMAPEPELEPEPEGVVEVSGRRLVDVSVLAAERKRARETAERTIREHELTPLQDRVRQLEDVERTLAQVRPYIETLQRRPDLMREPEPAPLEQQIAAAITDDEAAAEARDLELYDANTGQPDVPRARRIIAKRRMETMSWASHAAQTAMAPLSQSSAQDRSRQLFVALASQQDQHGQAIVDPQALAELWAQLPADLTQHPQVGEWLRDAAIGRSVRSGRRVASIERESLVTEAAGGRRDLVRMSDIERKLAAAAGVSDKAFAEQAKTYTPGVVNVIGD